MGTEERSSGWIGAVLLNRWRIDAKIARGGVATVFRAVSPDGDVAAIKIMHPEYARNDDVRRRFLREGYAANTIGHDAVVHILGHDLTPDGTPFLVMELLEGGESLEQRRERLGGRLPMNEVVALADRLLDVIAVAHDKGIIHRDIKPDNVFVKTITRPSGERDIGSPPDIKVLDFGIAHLKEVAHARSSLLGTPSKSTVGGRANEIAQKQERTATGLLLGTPEFMAPEQALGQRGVIDAQTDIYALGASMFTLLSGEAVHVHDALHSLIVAAATRQARSVRSTKHGKTLPRELVTVVDKALALEKGRRYPNARAMQTALRQVATAIGFDVDPEEQRTTRLTPQLPASDAKRAGEPNHAARTAPKPSVGPPRPSLSRPPAPRPKSVALPSGRAPSIRASRPPPKPNDDVAPVSEPTVIKTPVVHESAEDATRPLPLAADEETSSARDVYALGAEEDMIATQLSVAVEDLPTQTSLPPETPKMVGRPPPRPSFDHDPTTALHRAPVRPTPPPRPGWSSEEMLAATVAARPKESPRGTRVEARSDPDAETTAHVVAPVRGVPTPPPFSSRGSMPPTAPWAMAPPLYPPYPSPPYPPAPMPPPPTAEPELHHPTMLLAVLLLAVVIISAVAAGCLYLRSH